MSDQTDEDANKDPSSQGEVTRSDDEAPPKEGTEQQRGWLNHFYSSGLPSDDL
jgi:hypothetical protein